MRTRITTALLALVPCAALARSPLPIDTQEFTDEDFQHFFGLIEDGGISAEKLAEFCADAHLGFTFVGKELVHEGPKQRIDYNVTALEMTIDGRPFRSKYRSPSFGEWTREVFKPICPGLYSFTVEFEVRLPKRGELQDVSVQIYLQREGDTRPGLLLREAHAGGTGSLATGQATVVVPMATGDEISTWTVIAGDKGSRELTTVAISGYKIAHLPELAKAFSMDGWDEDMRALGSRLGASVPGGK